ncbi:MAG TPA: hypothetical protein PKJ24_04270 [Prolixibacteraceae bacterium]|nr:hypothetical protein [Prolixibacteraceae bacterium]HPT32621.1 hypothetical protein [Prolixibacteraceae bacterium]
MEHQKRTVLLEALCILSFIGNGIAIIVYLAAATWNNAARELIENQAAGGDVSRFTTVYFLLFTGLYLLSLSGVLLMWKTKKTGWFLYAAAQTTLLFLPSLWLEESVIPSANVIFTILFGVLYAREIFRRSPHSLVP